MKRRFVICLLFICFLLTIVHCKESKEKPKHEKPEKHEKDDKKNDENSNNESKKPGDDDYDTTQGYPILFPETHMMSLKRNVTTQPNTSATVTADIEDDEMYEAALNKSNSIAEQEGKCSKSVDLLFLLDSSESVKYSNWKIIIKFVKDLCNRFQLHSTRVGVIRYASEAEVALSLTEFNSTESRNLAIDNIFYKTGGTRTDIALKKAGEVLNVEEQRSQVLMLVTDGPTNRLEIDKDHFVEGKDLVAGPADRLKEAGVALFCIGVEPDSETPEEIDTMKEEMSMIASEPTKMHLFMSNGYRELERKVDLISNAACVVNGAWSVWSEYSPCSVTCGYGTKVRMRTCTSPSPENNGADCTGPRVEIEECDLGPCIVAPSDNKYPTISIRHSKPKEDNDVINQNAKKVNETVIDSEKNITNNSTQKEKTQSNNTAEHDGNSTTEHNGKPNTEHDDKPKTEHDGKLITEHDGKPIIIKWFDNNTSDNPNSEVKKENSKKTEKSQHHVPECFEGIEELKLNDSQYNASSIYTHDTDDEYVKKEYAPQNARLNNQVNGGGWCAEHKFASNGDKNQYLQFDLGKKTTIDAVASQGSHLLENWVKSYNLRYSDDGISWEYYNKNPIGGNNDRTSVQRTMLTPAIEARYVQLNPIEWNEENVPEKHDICMRAALYKCRDGAVAPVASVNKRGIIQSSINTPLSSSQEPSFKQIPRGVVLKEREWSHLPDQKTVFILSERSKRQIQHTHHKGNKRIFKKIRKTAKNIMRNLNRKVHSG